ncbi:MULTISPECIES: L,D-transpeptidase family protein [unclassified Synechococcus]|uniref:L,D-transpeptidase family protein n=1 Tax=unclassified Synechococcus TaxID=2626047 RepID=UPI0020CFDD5E|nr:MULTISPECIES: L,D-transpeptidase family protein [unclassified Synechococcus]
MPPRFLFPLVTLLVGGGLLAPAGALAEVQQPKSSTPRPWHPPITLPHTPAIQPLPQSPTPQQRQALPKPEPDAAVAIASPLPERSLVLHRGKRQVVVVENGRELRRFPVGVGMPGWETPLGRFQVIEMAPDPAWKHPVSGKIYPPGPNNPLGSRWIGFHRDCAGKRGFNGQQHLEVKGCVSAGFHGTPQRESIGQAVSHGCVRMYDENVRDLFELVRMGMVVTVLP